MIDFTLDTDTAIDQLFKYVDDLCLQDHFSEVDDFLDEIDLSHLDTDLIVAVLCITLPASHELHRREAFVKRAETRLHELCKPERVERLMKGLYA